jgi:hypothetical protein
MREMAMSTTAPKKATTTLSRLKPGQDQVAPKNETTRVTADNAEDDVAHEPVSHRLSAVTGYQPLTAVGSAGRLDEMLDQCPQHDRHRVAASPCR